MIKFLYLLLVTAVPIVFAAESQRTVVVLGDSIAAGFGVDAEEAFPAILQQRIDAARLPYRVVMPE
jgi:acyl-CoA thioesterase I